MASFCTNLDHSGLIAQELCLMTIMYGIEIYLYNRVNPFPHFDLTLAITLDGITLAVWPQMFTLPVPDYVEMAGGTFGGLVACLAESVAFTFAAELRDKVVAACANMLLSTIVCYDSLGLSLMPQLFVHGIFMWCLYTF